MLIPLYTIYHNKGFARVKHLVGCTLNYAQALNNVNDYIRKINTFVEDIEGRVDGNIIRYTFTPLSGPEEEIIIEVTLIPDFLENFEQEFRDFIELLLKKDPITLDMVRDILKI
jgi:hypothetical protein